MKALQTGVLEHGGRVGPPDLRFTKKIFWSPEPGVIVYQYRRARLVPVPVPEPEPVVVRRWQLELQPLTPQQRAAVTTTTMGGAMLLVMMLLLSPVGI